VNCPGTTINSSVVNLGERTVCARPGTITSASPYISVGDEGATCGSDPAPTPTPTVTSTPTVTPTSTPTATPEPTYDSYFVEIHTCGQCEYGNGYNNGLGGYVRFPSNFTPTIGKFYRDSPPFDFYSYKILNYISGPTNAPICLTTPYDSCYDACGQSLPTPTPTPTATPVPPTPTPTPTATPVPTFTPTPTPTATPVPPTETPTPTPTATPTPLPDGVSSFGSTDGGFIQCGAGYDSNDYEYYRTYEVIFTSARNTMGYVVVYLSDNSNIQIPFNENDTSASTTVFCGCGSPCADMEMVMNIIYTTPTPTPTLEPTFTPTPTSEGGGPEETLLPE
jgi:hypothetical protein